MASDALSWLERAALFYLTPYARRMRLALAPARAAQWTGLDALARRIGLVRLLPRAMRSMHAMVPPLRPHYGRLPEVLPAIGKRRARVGLFLGCAADAFFPQTNLATARVLQHNGCEVVIPRSQACCGALHYHAGYEDDARAMAENNVRAFFGAGPKGSQTHGDLDALVVNAAGCGAMLKDYGHLFSGAGLGGDVAAAAASFAGKVKDVSEWLVELGPVAPVHSLVMKATYHDACHLCHAQQIRRPPRQLLEMIPGLSLVPLAESELCCGAAGSYNLTQPEMADRLGERKADNVLATEADAVFAGNVGCLLQLGRHLRPRKPGLIVAHPVDALWASYQGKALSY
jgi:glycolate oxidase iron-sulfur subunit